MKKFISWLLVIAVTAVLAVSGTMAYLTDTDEDVNVRTIGNIHIQQIEQERVDTETGGAGAPLQDFRDNKPLYPAVTEGGFEWETEGSELWDPTKINNEQDKIVSLKNTGDYDAYVRTVIAFEAGGFAWEQFQKKMHLNINKTDWDWEWITEPVIIGDSAFFLGTATYKTPLEPGQTTSPSLLQVALDPSAENMDVERFGVDYVILAASQAIQTEGFHAPQTALEDGFYQVTAQQHPFTSEMLPYYIYDQTDLQDFGTRGGLGILMTDIEMDSFATFNRPNTVLDMNGHTIYNNRYASAAFIFKVDYGGNLTVTGNGKFIPIQDLDTFSGRIFTFLCTREGSVLTIENGYVDASHGDNISNTAVQCQSKAKVIINDCTFIRSDCSDASELMYACTGGTIEINGGLFRNDGSAGYLMNISHPSTMTIRGGTFVNHNPGVTNDAGYIKVAEGYKTVSEVREDGDTYYTVVPVE